MSTRTYNPSVRVGNWNEDIQLEEDTLKDFLEKRERGELLIQKSTALKDTVLCEKKLSISRTGKVHFGDTVMLVNPAPEDKSRGASVLSLNVSIGDCNSPNVPVAASTVVQPSARSSFAITSMDGTPRGEPLCFGKPFYLCTPDESMFLTSDRATFTKSAKKSRHNDVTFVPKPAHLTEWKVIPHDPKFRMELEYTPVPANAKIIFVHIKTNQALCVEKDFLLRTPFGKEYEVTTHTSLDSHKAETDVNHWQIVMNEPGDANMPVQPPQ